MAFPADATSRRRRDILYAQVTGAGPSPCKFGDRCRFFARGCCRNYHPQVPIEPLGEHNWYY